MPVNNNTTLLRNSAYISLDASARIRFCRLAEKITNWEHLVEQAEVAALSNILYSHLKSCGISIPAANALTFRALTARHQRLNRDRTAALIEILGKCSEQDTEVILLKGMALIHNLYTDKCQRPMGDIDILVKRHQALLVQESLREIGYSAGDRKQGCLFDHHHLAVATRSINGMVVQVEVHHDALSGDAISSMTFDAVAQNRIPICVGGRNAATLGHVDMLRHLCHHTFEPCETIKLGAIADIYGYATKYINDIDWQYIDRQQSFVKNTLRCLHFLTPLPEILSEKVGRPICSSPGGVGNGFPPLSNILNSEKSFPWKLKNIFFCSQWWLHIYYQIPPENSLIGVKLIRHPMRVGFWFYRRLLAQLKSKLRKPQSL